MNYVILNERKKFQNKINIHGLKEVDVNGSDRVDAIFAHITKQLLEQLNSDEGTGNAVLPGLLSYPRW